MKYNERIREIREDSSLTQQKVADLLHIGQRTYADYESGKTRIPVDNLFDSCQILQCFYGLYHRSKQYQIRISKSIGSSISISIMSLPVALLFVCIFRYVSI